MMSFTRNISCWLRQQQQQRPNAYVNQSATLSRELDKEKYEQTCVSPVSDQMRWPAYLVVESTIIGIES